ncbi:MAG: hypothetical protein ACRY3E_01280, partial [Candidatus Lariskella arthropodorum]
SAPPSSSKSIASFIFLFFSVFILVTYIFLLTNIGSTIIYTIFDKDSKKEVLLPLYQAFAGGLTLAILLFYLGYSCGKRSAKAYVYVDIERIVQAIVSSFSSDNLREDELEARVDYHRQKFQELLNDYSASCSVMIIAKPKVLSGAPDKTDFFIEKLLGGEA